MCIWKRATALLLCLLLCLGGLPGTAWGTETEIDGGLSAGDTRNGESGTLRCGENSYWFEDGQLLRNGTVSEWNERDIRRIALSQGRVYAIVGEKEAWVLIDGGSDAEENAAPLASSGAQQNKQTIYAFVIDTLGVSVAVACGILANVEAECSFDPNASCIDTNGLTSYGICQWNGDRFTALKSFGASRGLDYTTLDAQLQYLEYELNGSEKSAFTKVKDVENSAQGAYDAGYKWARWFERCNSAYYERRAVRARDVFWAEYGSVPNPAEPASVSRSEVEAKLAQLLQTYPHGSTWTGSFDGGIQCYGFAKLVLYNLFGKTASGAYRSWNYAGNSLTGLYLVDQISSYSESTVKNLLSKAAPGDLLQFSGGTKSQHSMIVYSVGATSVCIYECNWDNACGISKTDISFAKFANRGTNRGKLSLIRSDNYDPNAIPVPTPPIPTMPSVDNKLLNPMVFNLDFIRASRLELRGLSDEELTQHWLMHGIHESAGSQVFDVKWYKDYYNAELGNFSDEDAIIHFVDYGVHESRKSSKFFSLSDYKSNYKDLQNAFGNNNPLYCLHYIDYGWGEGRIANRRLSIKFDANGGSCETTSQNYTCYAPYGPLPTPTRQGYTFTGWYTDRENGDRITAETQAVYADDTYLTVYAHWEANGGCYLDVNGYCNGAITPSVAGYGTFDVYINGVRVKNDIADFWNDYSVGTTYEIRDVKPLNGYTYHGIHSGTRQGTLNGNAELVLEFSPIDTSGIGSPAATVTRDNHIYKYYPYEVTWHTAKQFCEEQGGHLATVTSDEENTLIGDLIRNLLSHDGVWLGGTNISGSWQWVTGEPFTFGATGNTYPWNSGEPNDYPSDEGGENYLDFASLLVWNDNASCSARGFIFEKEIETYTIQYDANGGTGAPAAQTKTQGVPLTLSSTVPTRSGYTFLGWAESQSATAAQYQPSGSFTKDANTTLYAVWKSNVVSVTGVTLNKTSLTLNKGASETLTATVSPSNATNKSVTWSSSNTSVATVDSNGKVTAVSAGSTTVTVKTNDGGKTATCAVTVKPNTYTITYDANGGAGAPAPQTKTQDVTLTLSSTVPTRSGYAFLGWAESKTATTAQYQPGGSFTKNANTTLYAVWKSAPTGREEDGILTVESVRARPGAEVSVGVSFTNNPGVMVMALGLDYDRSVLTLTGFEDGGFTGWSVNTSAIWLGDSDSTFNGTILKLKFRVADNAPEGDIPVTLRYSEGDIANANETALLPKCNPGKVTVSNNLPGDITGDGKVNAMDLLRLKKYLAGDSVTLVGSGDITGDGKINAMDLLRLKKYLAGDDVVIHRIGEPDANLMASGQAASLSVSTASGGPGDTVTLDISIANNPGIMVLNPKLSFNSDALEYVGYEDAGLTGWTVTERGMVWIGDTETDLNGVILKLKFHIKESAPSGLAEVTLLCEDGDAANENEEIVSLSVTGGGVQVNAGNVGSVEIRSFTVKNGTADIKVQTSLATQTIQVVIAAYDATERCLGVLPTTLQTTETAGVYRATAKLNFPGAVHYRAFVVTADGWKPLTDCAEVR